MSAREQLIATESEAMRAAFRRWMQAVYGLDIDTAEEYHRTVAQRLASKLEITANALRDSETKLAAAHLELERRQNDRTQPAMGMDGEEPVKLSGTTLPHRALNIEVRP